MNDPTYHLMYLAQLSALWRVLAPQEGSALTWEQLAQPTAHLPGGAEGRAEPAAPFGSPLEAERMYQNTGAPPPAPPGLTQHWVSPEPGGPEGPVLERWQRLGARLWGPPPAPAGAAPAVPPLGAESTPAPAALSPVGRGAGPAFAPLPPLGAVEGAVPPVLGKPLGEIPLQPVYSPNGSPNVSPHIPPNAPALTPSVSGPGWGEKTGEMLDGNAQYFQGFWGNPGGRGGEVPPLAPAPAPWTAPPLAGAPVPGPEGSWGELPAPWVGVNRHFPWFQPGPVSGVASGAAPWSTAPGPADQPPTGPEGLASKAGVFHWNMFPETVGHLPKPLDPAGEQTTFSQRLAHPVTGPLTGPAAPSGWESGPAEGRDTGGSGGLARLLGESPRPAPVVRLTTQAPVIQVTGQNTGHSAADRLRLTQVIRDALLEQLATGASLPGQ